jgi:hypothetical protein
MISPSEKAGEPFRATRLVCIQTAELLTYALLSLGRFDGAVHHSRHLSKLGFGELTALVCIELFEVGEDHLSHPPSDFVSGDLAIKVLVHDAD